MQTILIDAGARRWTLRVVLVGLLAAAIVALAATADAQDHPQPPHWFWGNDAYAYAGATVTAIDADGNDVGSGGVGSDGGWYVAVQSEDASRVKLRITNAKVTRETAYMDVKQGGFDPAGVSISAFTNFVDDDLQETVPPSSIEVRIVARRADDGRIEFGMRDQHGEEIFPRARYFPNGGPGHSRWLRSSEIDFGDGFVGRIVARFVEETGRTEFGFRVEGYDDIFPRARFFPATGPDHNRWLTSTPIEISQPR